MHALWRFIFCFRRLSVTILPAIGGAAALLDEQFNELFKAAVPNWYQLTLLIATGTATIKIGTKIEVG
jgi:hypothetical protein